MENENPSPKEALIAMIKERSIVKQDVYAVTKTVFDELKLVLEEVIGEIRVSFGEADARVQFGYNDKGDYEAEVQIAGDVLLFYMHTNVFQFDQSNSLWKSSYLIDNELNGYVGVLNVYNFLSDSFKFQRLNDRGYLIARMFVNRERHFLVQGKRQLGYKFNDFLNMTVDKERLREFVLTAMTYTLGFDLYAPPYQQVQEITVAEVEAMSHHLKVATGKRLGFKFSFDDESESI